MRIGTQQMVALALALVLPSCGGGGSSPTAPTPTPTPGPSQAVITINCNAYTVTNSPIHGFKFRITFPCTATESAGLGAFANYVRAGFTKNGVEIEAQQIGSSDITAAAGTNRLEGHSSFTANLIFDFNHGDATGGTLKFNFTDDRHNDLTANLTF